MPNIKLAGQISNTKFYQGECGVSNVIQRCLLIIGGLILLAYGVACGEGMDVKVVDGYAIGKYGGVLTTVLPSEPKTFNRLLVNDASTAHVLGQIFESLVEINGVTAQVEPALAQAWEYSADGKVWIFKLRQGVRWHDGVEFTADDVIFTLDLIYDDRIINSYRDVLQVDGQPLRYRKLNTYTIEFTLPKPFAPMLRAMLFPILPKHKLYDVWRQGNFNNTWGVNTKPGQIVGTGPFQLRQYVPGQHIALQRNANYWKVDPQGQRLPYLEELFYRIVENQDALALLFISGELDICFVPGTMLATYQTGALGRQYTIYNAGPDFGTLFYVFNMNSRFVSAPQLNWLTEKRFRQAVAHAVDKETIINALFGGHAVAQWSYESVAKGIFSNPNVRKYPYDLDRAAQLLTEAGFTKDGKGVLRDSAGHKVELEIITHTGNKQREILATLLAEDLTELGMEISLSFIDFNLLVNRLYTGKDWSVMVMGLSGGNQDPNSSANVWRSDGNLHMWNVGWSTPQTAWEARIDTLYDLGAVTLDENKRLQYYFEAQEIIAEQVPIIYTVAETLYVAAKRQWANIKPTSFGGLTHNIEVIYQK
jgi:peptide/nickel transport system substrate-binding protein